MSENTLIGEFTRMVRKGEENALAAWTAVRGAGAGSEEIKVLALQNRALQPEPPQPPQRAESPRRAHTFHDVVGFIAFLDKYKTADTVVLADIEEGVIHAVLDDQAEHGFEYVTCAPAVHPLFEPWQEFLDAPNVNVLGVAQFLMTHRRAITEPDGRELALTLSQVKASKQVTISAGVGKKSINGVMVETTIQGERKNELVELPDSITIEAPLFLNTDPCEIEIDLLVFTSDDEVRVSATSGDVLEARTKAFEEMLDAVRNLDGAIVSTGKPSHEPWAYIGESPPVC